MNYECPYTVPDMSLAPLEGIEIIIKMENLSTILAIEAIALFIKFFPKYWLPSVVTIPSILGCIEYASLSLHVF